VQRIQLAKQPRKDAGELLQDGDVVTACQQSCPTDAITFGNTRESGAELNKKAEKGDKRAYHSLHVLNVRPGITYLAQVKRDGEESHA